MREVCHWPALIFVAAVCLQLLRLFFTGSSPARSRRPRGLTWLIWVSLLLQGMAAGWTGTVLPHDMMSGGSPRVLQGVLESIPAGETPTTHRAPGRAAAGRPGRQLHAA